MKLGTSYLWYLSLPKSQLVVLPPGHEIVADGHEAVILFIFADWSGASQFSFRELNKALRGVPGVERIQLWVADTDEKATNDFMVKAGDVPGGCGETYWLRNGIIVGKLARVTDQHTQLIGDLTRQILET